MKTHLDREVDNKTLYETIEEIVSQVNLEAALQWGSQETKMAACFGQSV